MSFQWVPNEEFYGIHKTVRISTAQKEIWPAMEMDNLWGSPAKKGDIKPLHSSDKQGVHWLDKSDSNIYAPTMCCF